MVLSRGATNDPAKLGQPRSRVICFAIGFLVLCTWSHVSGLNVQECNDPATPLRQLAIRYERWPAAPSERASAAFDEFKNYLLSGEAAQYHKTLLELKRLDEIHPSNPHIKLVLGVLYASGPDLNYPNGEGYRHSSISTSSLARTYATEALNSALQKDSSQWLAVLALTRIALVTPDSAAKARAENQAKQALKRDAQNIGLHLAVHDLLVRQEKYTDALSTIGSVTSSCAAVRHADAEARILTGDTAKGAQAYLNALRAATPDELNRFYDDIRPMATVGQLTAYRQLDPGTRAKWIEDFWLHAAIQSGRTIEARLVEQIMRAAYADAHFQGYSFPPSTDRPVTWISDTTHLVPWDARGVVYVRHGAPLRRFHRVGGICGVQQERTPAVELKASKRVIRDSGPETRGLCEVEAWIVAGELEDWPIAFVHVVNAPFDWGMSYGTGCYFPPDDWVKKRTSYEETEAKADRGDMLTIREIYQIFARYDPTYLYVIDYCEQQARGRPTVLFQEPLRQIFEMRRSNILAATWSESAAPRLHIRLPMAVAAYQFRDERGMPEVSIVSWISSDRLNAVSPRISRLRTTFVLADSLVGGVISDTTISIGNLPPRSSVFVSRTLKPGEVVSGLAKVFAVDPADSTRGAAATATFAMHADTGTVNVSSIVIARPVREGPFTRGRTRLTILPDHIVRRGDDFRLFLEIYGITAEAAQQVAINITKRDVSTGALQSPSKNAREAKQAVSFPVPVDLDTRGVTTVDVDIATENLLIGEYDVEVTVKSGDRSVSRRTTVRVEVGRPW